MKVDLVFEGGGILGVTFVGAYQALSEAGYEVERSAGTSAGSIISSLIIAGYSANELIQIMNTTDFSKFLHKTTLSNIPILGKPLSVIFNKGIYDIGVIENWMEELLRKKGVRTFRDVMVNGVSRLKVIAADITNRKLLIFPDSARFYNERPDDFSVAKTVAMSCSIPLFFTPIKIKKDDYISYIVDGGLISTFPIWVFDVEGLPAHATLGFKIQDPISLTSKGKTGIIAYIKDLINATINKEETVYLREDELVRTIIIDFDQKTKSTDLDIGHERIKYLYQCGYNATKTFLKTWNFLDYIKRYRL